MPAPDATVLTAAWVAPMVGPVVRDGAVAIVAGRVAAVGHAADVRRAVPAAIITDLGDAVLLPGLVNAHCHSELSHLRPGPPPASFVGWLTDLMKRAGPGDPAAAATAGAAESLAFGVTAVGDVTAFPAATRGPRRRGRPGRRQLRRGPRHGRPAGSA